MKGIDLELGGGNELLRVSSARDYILLSAFCTVFGMALLVFN